MSLINLIRQLRSKVGQKAEAPPAAPPPEVSHSLVPVTITGNVGSGSGGSDAGGHYTGTIKLPPASDLDDDGGNLALGEGMLDGDTCVIINAEETGLPTHWIKPGAYQLAQCVHVEPDGKQVLMVNGGYYRIASPVDLEPDDALSWDRDIVTSGSDHGDKPVRTYLVTSNVDGDTLAARRALFDAGGRLKSLGDAESGLLVTPPWQPTITPPTTPPGVGTTIFVWNGVTVHYPGTTVTGTGTSLDPYVITSEGGESFTVTQGPDGGADVDVTHDTGVAVLSRGFEILFIFGENTTLDATNTSPTTQGFWAGSDNDNMDLSAVPSMPGGWAATWRIQGGTLRVKFTAIPDAGNSLKIAGVVRRTPPLVDT